ncbi:TPA: DUF3800 domain-containing protein [Citrobacter freundii]|uniref:DUF3800 domain-containing protein n=1 Tax=Citrobacter freundii TaxID=546 RepID=UPI0018AA4897|nr:DUF3800 domain-containing protein [Citrobacter freundii]MBJ9133001.1 DUF3800 domain-containing protein [Citrobacter freundii]HEE0085846.1 DUF3800 domain-containing protein [Citrobacter freundii]HEJ0092642.1 DUF3800 domain-containing protein [Citrobacter freundii]HEJ0142020.1 DUF3800 domain-containing protein [Citrobacter freundii]
MFIAIDDTYSDPSSPSSVYVTANRRTHVAVIFSDEDAEDVRTQLPTCFEEINKQFKLNITEFHFKDIMNKKNEWRKLPKKMRLAIFSFFAYLYNHYKWEVLIQTVDDRTIDDLGPLVYELSDGVESKKVNSVLSLSLLLLKIRMEVKSLNENITIIMDEGEGKPNDPFGYKFFPDMPEKYRGYYESSKNEPLLQMADFIAYSINRMTYLAMKPQRNEDDNEFIEIISNMDIKCQDLKKTFLPIDFSVNDFDVLIKKDRDAKGLL